MRALALALALVAAAGATASAQRVRPNEVPRRPVMWAGADTNSAEAYYGHGIQRLNRDPAEAAAAFYWAARIRPGWADALYGRRVALLMTDRRRLVRYMSGERSVYRNAEVQAIDSLQLRALMLDPFLMQKFDKDMFAVYVEEFMNELVQAYTGERNAAQAAYLTNQWLADADPMMKARFNYSQGKYPLALAEYERALRRARKEEKPGLRTDVARIHFFSGNHPQALEAFRTAIEEFRALDERDLVFVYESKALLEHSIATIHERAGQTDEAREAYGRALQEDLAFFPAHLRLAAIALAEGDTATALAEWALAAEIAPNEAAVQHEYGVFLLKLGKIEEGLARVQKAAEVEPYYAAPHFVLARLHDQSSIPEGAIEHYRAWLERAPRDDPQRAAVQARVAALQAELNAPPAPAEPAPPASTPPGGEGR